MTAQVGRQPGILARWVRRLALLVPLALGGPAALGSAPAAGSFDMVGGVSPSFLLHLPAILGPEDAGDAPADETAALRQRLLEVAERYGEASYIPYVWGGSGLADEPTCRRCRDCLMKRAKVPVPRRHAGCAACRQCGMDCSHFLNRVYREAGLPIPYASSAALSRGTPAEILRNYDLVYVGRTLAEAEPGDILVHDRHVSMFLEWRGGQRADILHVSRSITRRGVPGGVEIVRDADLRRFRGGVKRVFRHAALVGPRELRPGGVPEGGHRMAHAGDPRVRTML